MFKVQWKGSVMPVTMIRGECCVKDPNHPQSTNIWWSIDKQKSFLYQFAFLSVAVAWIPR